MTISIIALTPWHFTLSQNFNSFIIYHFNISRDCLPTHNFNFIIFHYFLLIIIFFYSIIEHCFLILRFSYSINRFLLNNFFLKYFFLQLNFILFLKMSFLFHLIVIRIFLKLLVFYFKWVFNNIALYYFHSLLKFLINLQLLSSYVSFCYYSFIINYSVCQLFHLN